MSDVEEAAEAADETRPPGWALKVGGALVVLAVILGGLYLLDLPPFRDDQGLDDVAEAIGAPDDGVQWRGDAESLVVEISEPDAVSSNWLGVLLEDLGFPSSTMARMEQTRALDGTLEDEAGGVRVTWTYHPDDGLSVVFSDT